MTPDRPSSPVEPLSQKAWERVEARVFERLDRGELLLPRATANESLARAPLWIGAAALLAAASVLLWWRFEAAPLLANHAASGSLHASAAPLAAPGDLAAAPADGTRIVTTTAPAQTSLGEAELTLSAHSDLRLSGSDAAGWLVRLEAGQIDCQVAPRHGRPAFVVEAGSTRVTVVGTRFTVSREGELARVSVSEGHVRVASGALELILGPGQSWPVTPAAADPSPPPAEAAPFSPRTGTAPGPRQSRNAAPSAARERFERATRLEASDPEAALGLYAALAKTRGPWAANALYAQARLELERGAVSRARPLLLRYLKRHPKGVNAGDVRTQLDKLER